MNWETNKQPEITELTSKGIVPHEAEIKAASSKKEPYPFVENTPLFMGQGAGLIDSIVPAEELVHQLVAEAVEALSRPHAMIKSKI